MLEVILRTRHLPVGISNPAVQQEHATIVSPACMQQDARMDNVALKLCDPQITDANSNHLGLLLKQPSVIFFEK